MRYPPMPPRKPWQVSMPSLTDGRATPEELAAGYRRAALPPQLPPAKPPSLWDKVQSSLMPMPAGAEGLLSPEDIKGARSQGLMSMGASLLADSGPKTAENYVSTGQALGKAIQAGQGAGQSALGEKSAVMQLQAAKTGLEGKQMELQKAKALTGVRQNIIKAHPMPKGNIHAMRDWIDEVLPLFIEGQDDETVQHLTQIRATIPDKEKPKFDTIDTGGEIIDRMINPDGTIKEIGRTRKVATPNKLMMGELMTPAARERAENNIITRFDHQTSDYTKAHEAYSQVMGVLQRSRSNTHSPDDIIQLIDGISRLNNPGAVVRTGTVAIQLQKIGSAAEKLRMWADRNKSGAWPQDIVEGIARAARGIAQEHEKQYNDLRKRAEERGRRIGLDYMDSVLPNVWADGTADRSGFHPPMALPGAGASAASQDFGH